MTTPCHDPTQYSISAEDSLVSAGTTPTTESTTETTTESTTEESTTEKGQFQI